MKYLLILFFSFSIVSCGKQIESLIPTVETQAIQVESAVAEKYSYEFRTKSCSTGNHKASTFIEICISLKNHSLNNECADEEREVLFLNSECPGNYN